jgi:thymidine phosphorylase
MATTAMLAQEVIRTKRDGGALTAAQIDAFVQGLTSGGWSDSQAAALAMAIVLRGMDGAETVALTRAMTRSGSVLDWRDAGLHGPVLDKHSTGGVGDKVSLLLAPIVAACGGVVPMISGRGLGHTGGTLDKLEALPGYTVEPSRDTLLATLREAGCAIVGATADLAPADRRLYAVRDVTATVESVPLITASILSKKLAAGLQGLVLDVKVGSGAFAPTLVQGRELATSLVRTAQGAGLPAVALLTDMSRVLGRTAGNALEVQEALALLRGDAAAAGDAECLRLRQLTLTLAAGLMMIGGLHTDAAAAQAAAEQALESGAAAERFARMVARLGGPGDVLRDAQLPVAPVQRPVTAPRAGFVAAIDARALGLTVVALGGGRNRAGAMVDPRVGLAGVLAPGTAVQAGDALAVVHAANVADAEAAALAVAAAMPVADGRPPQTPLLLDTVRG